MFRTLFIAAGILALASARPNIVGMFEEEITKALQDYFGPKDPSSFSTIKDVKISSYDTSLVFNFEDATLSGLSTVECTKFSPPLFTKDVTLTLTTPNAYFHANSYNAMGTLKGNPLSASGTADLEIYNYGFTLGFKIDSYSKDASSLCIAKGSLSVDLFIGRVNANFENAYDLNDELNTNGPKMIESLQAQIMQNEDQIIDNLNNALCK